MRAPEGIRIKLGRRHGDHVEATITAEEVIHACPLSGSGTTPCCERSPFEVSRWHRLTLDPSLVTCGR